MGLPAPAYKHIVAATFVVALFMDLLDITIVNVALPTLGREFGAGPNTLEWVVTGYLLSLAVWVPASGWLGDRFGTRRIFLLALSVFLLGSLLCALAWNIITLVAFRVLQGAGGGMLTPVGMTLLFRAFPPEERPRVGAILLVPSLIAPALGPIIGGVLVTAVDWRWIFLLNLPLGLAALLLGARYLREHREPAPGRFDLWGFAGSGIGLALALYALSHGPAAGWAAPEVIATGAGGLAILGAVACYEWRRPAPMLDLRLFADRAFGWTSLFFVVLFAGWMGTMFLLPLYLQDLHGLSALASGLTTFPQALGLILTIRLSTRLAGRADPRRTLMLGAVAVAVTTAPLLLLDQHTNLWVIRAALLVRGMAMGLIAVTVQTAPYANISPAAMGRAMALTGVNRHVCSALGVAALATVLIERGGTPGAGPDAMLGGFHAAFAVAVLLSLAALVVTLVARSRPVMVAASQLVEPAAETVAAD